MGKILAICTSPKRGTVKTEVPSAVLTPEWGIVSDAHGGNWHRQVSLLSAEKIEAFRKKIWVDYGAFGENLVIEGFDFRSLPVTSRFAIGDVVLEMTQIGKECHNDCVIKQQTGECIMPREGVFTRVLHGGTISVGGEDIWENAALKARMAAIPDDWYYFLQANVNDMMRFYRGFYPAFSQDKTSPFFDTLICPLTA